MSDIKAKLDQCTAQLTGAGSPYEVGREVIGGIEYKVYKQAPVSMKQLLDAGRAHGDKDFLIYEDERLSFTAFYAKADALAYQLIHALGVKKGDRIAIAMRNYPEWMIAFVAITSIGAVVVPLNSWGQAHELEYGLKDSAATLVVCDGPRYALIAQKLPTLKVQAIIARLDQPIADSAIEFNRLIEGAMGQSMPEVAVTAEDLAMIMYTSGTTGNPKGAVSNQRNIIQAIMNFECAAYAAAMSNPETIGKMLEKGFGPKVLLAVPLFHVSGCHSVFLLALRGGRPIVMMYKWDTERALKLVQDERITMISAVPTMLWQMLDSPRFKEYDTSSLFSVGAGGAAQPPRLPELIMEKVDNVFPGTGYGMTETNASGFAATGASYKHKPLSCGTQTPIVDIRIVDDGGNEVGQGQTGEICLRTPTMVQGYWNKPEATAETFQDGWVMTGDVGYLDDEGYLFITDRIKDMVIRAGENIYSAEIESCIYARPDIEEIAAFGIPHDTLGEELAVAVCCKPESVVTAEDIQNYVREKLATFKVPSHIFFRDEPLPRNATGKILKKQLRDTYAKALNRL